MIEVSFVASWWLMLCILCAQQVIYFLGRVGLLPTVTEADVGDE